MNADIKKIVSRVKTAQSKLQDLMQNQDWMEEAKTYAEKQRNEVRKLLTADLGKVKTFVERERKELERFQRQIPGEVKRFRGLLAKQGKELEKLLNSMSAPGKKKKSTKKSTSKKSTAKQSTKKASS